MNRKEFQEWLEQFPEDTVIEVGIQQSAPSYCPYGEVKFEEFVGDYDQHDLNDFRGNNTIGNQHKYYGKVYLQLGSSS
jgi:hypothetical protein